MEKLAQNNINGDVREAAAKKLEDKSVLIQIAQNEHDKDVMIIMLERINEL